MMERNSYTRNGGAHFLVIAATLGIKHSNAFTLELERVQQKGGFCSGPE